VILPVVEDQLDLIRLALAEMKAAYREPSGQEKLRGKKSYRPR
jgi:hypothetical protein